MASIKNRGPNASQVRVRRAGYPTVTETFATEDAMKNRSIINPEVGAKILDSPKSEIRSFSN